MATARTPKIVCVVTSIHPDYDARVYKHCLSVQRLGYRTVLISPWPARDDGIERLTFERSAGIQGRLRHMAAIWPRLRKVNADIYHFHDLDLVPLMTAWHMVSGKPVVYDVHENYAEEMLYRHWVPSHLRLPLYLALKVGEPLATSILRNVVIVVESQTGTVAPPWLHTLLLRNYASRSLAAGAVDDHDRRPPGVIFSGRPHAGNGLHVFLDVAASVSRTHPGVRFYLTDFFSSKDSLRDDVLARLEREGLTDTVHFLPRVLAHEIMQHLNQAAIAVSFDLRIPARLKALPVKLFEYMAAGLPIVSSDLPLAQSVIDSSHCGLLGRPEDPESLAKGVRHLLDNPALARQLGQNGQRAFMDRFNWESQEPALAAFYQRLLPEPN